MIFNKEKHTNTDPYPVKSDYTTVYITQRGELLWSGKLKDMPGTFIGQYFTKESVVDNAAFNEARQAWQRKDNKLFNEWREAVIDEAHSVCNLPRRVIEIAFSHSWNEHHSSGHGQAESNLSDYIELAQSFINAYNESK